MPALTINGILYHLICHTVIQTAGEYQARQSDCYHDYNHDGPRFTPPEIPVTYLKDFLIHPLFRLIIAPFPYGIDRLHTVDLICRVKNSQYID